MSERTATVERKTRETDIRLVMNLDGSGTCVCETGIGFFDHILEGFARHGLFDINLECVGDIHVDTHHTIEDVGIVLGEAIKKALGDKKGIKRYGHFYLPMDEALILCAVDLSGRPYFVSDVTYTMERIGDLETEMIYDFFSAVTSAAEMNLHIMKMNGTNNHHLAEASFKAFAKALDMATQDEPRMKDVWSTKGVL